LGGSKRGGVGGFSSGQGIGNDGTGCLEATVGNEIRLKNVLNPRRAVRLLEQFIGALANLGEEVEVFGL
jgi:hypothetical protein